MQAMLLAFNDCRIAVNHVHSLAEKTRKDDPKGCTAMWGMPLRDKKKGCTECFLSLDEESADKGFAVVQDALLKTGAAYITSTSP